MTLASDEYDEIRLMIGGDIDEDDLPDRRIDAGTVLGAAESFVLARILAWGGMNGLLMTRQRDGRIGGRYCIAVHGY